MERSQNYFRPGFAATVTAGSPASFPTMNNKKYAIAGWIMLALATVLIIATILMLLGWPRTAAQTNPIAQATTLPPVATSTEPTLADQVAQYLIKKKSPLKDHAAYLVQQPHWKLIVAVSAIESTYCQHQLFYNCWGIKAAKGQATTDQGYAKYKDYDDAILATETLLAKWQNKGRWLTPEDMNCSYVVPCSPNWVYVVKKTLKELEKF